MAFMNDPSSDGLLPDGMTLDDVSMRQAHHILATTRMQLEVAQRTYEAARELMDRKLRSIEDKRDLAISMSDALSAIRPDKARMLYNFGLTSDYAFGQITKADLLALPKIGASTVRDVENAGIQFADVTTLEKNSWLIEVAYDSFIDDSPIAREQAELAAPMTARNLARYGHVRHYRASRLLHAPKELNFFELANAAIQSLGYENNAPHAFFLDGQAWSPAAAYYPGILSEQGFTGVGTTEDTPLTVLKEGQEFLLVFDFADEWHFRCRVKSETFGTPDLEEGIWVANESGWMPRRPGYGPGVAINELGEPGRSGGSRL
ncbi:hypothetical protein ALMA_0847 [Alloscardovia macacae]|uniref:Uncharacterized protein n=2 Tax=Alloscardovia macacae TaxID=1160091 RepID=A0A261F659_9BIFI|nr:hypothetical protein ALMA_0847 [Alloscardovia macacae]